MQLEKIQELNLATIEVKGKPYVEVKERVRAFRQLFPNGDIRTRVTVENGTCLCTADIYDTENGDTVHLSSGSAFEVKGEGMINKTSFVENCETSAVGRALGFLGIGIDTGICSADELSNKSEEAAAEQRYEEEGKEIIEEKYVKALRTKLANGHITEESVCKLFSIEKIEELNYKQFRYINDNFAKMVEAVKNGNDSKA